MSDDIEIELAALICAGADVWLEPDEWSYELGPTSSEVAREVMSAMLDLPRGQGSAGGAGRGDGNGYCGGALAAPQPRAEYHWDWADQ